MNVSKLKSLEGKIENVELSLIQFDESYQREVKAHVRYIRDNFEAAAVGVPLIARRGTQGLFGIDARQRITAMLSLGITHCKCQVIESSGPTYEAYLFRLVNDNKGRKSLNTRELFKAALTANDPNALGVKSLVEKHGLKLGLWSSQKEWPHVRCVGILYKTFSSSDGERILGKTLELIGKMWPGSTEGLNETIIGGVALLVRARQFDEQRFVDNVGRVPPKTIRQDASGMVTGNRFSSVADHMVGLYNKRLKAGSPIALRLFSDKSKPEEPPAGEESA
jgi:hypothetical protein